MNYSVDWTGPGERDREPEEGGPCPEPGCGGRLAFKRPEDCSCHISPPCGHCVEAPLTCDTCNNNVPND